MSRYGHSILFSILISHFLGCLLTAPLTAAAVTYPECRAGHYDERAKVRYVIDGDTVVLTDGRKVRIIGIDTPELGHDGRPDQPYARQARRYLAGILHAPHNEIELAYDRDRYDHYHRTLAHVFLPDGSNIDALILARGLATPLVIPSNLAFLNCYSGRAEKAVVTVPASGN